MNYLWTTISVKNMEESLKFYQDVLDLKLVRRFQPNPDMEISFLGEGDTQVELIYNSDSSEIDYSDNISMGFKTESAADFIKKLNGLGIKIHSGPVKPNPQMQFFHILDPNGLKIQIVEFL